MTNDEFLSRYVFKELTEDVLAECEHFSCGVGDLDELYQDVAGTWRQGWFRFLIVDARNAPDALAYYEKNGFTYLFPSEEVESISTRKDKAVVPQNTRLMYFDLKDSTE